MCEMGHWREKKVPLCLQDMFGLLMRLIKKGLGPKRNMGCQLVDVMTGTDKCSCYVAYQPDSSETFALD